MGERLLASVEVSQRQPDCITWLQGGSSFFFYFTVLAVVSLKPCGTWKCGLLASHSVTADLQCSLFSAGLARLAEDSLFLLSNSRAE